MHFKISKRPMREDNPELGTHPLFSKLNDHELRWLCYCFDCSDDNDYMDIVDPLERKLEVLKLFYQVPLDTTTAALPAHFTDADQKVYRRWWRIVMGQTERTEEARYALEQMVNSVGKVMQKAYKNAMGNFSRLLEKDSDDAKLVAQQIVLAKEWPKLMANMEQIEKTAQKGVDAIMEKSQEDAPDAPVGKTAWEIAQERISEAEREDKEADS